MSKVKFIFNHFYSTDYKALINLSDLTEEIKKEFESVYDFGFENMLYKRVKQSPVFELYRYFKDTRVSLINEALKTYREEEYLELCFFNVLRIRVGEKGVISLAVKEYMYSVDGCEGVWLEIEDQQVIADFMEKSQLMNVNIVEDFSKCGYELMRLNGVIAAWFVLMPNLSVLDILSHKITNSNASNALEFVNELHGEFIENDGQPSKEDEIRKFFQVVAMLEYIYNPTRFEGGSFSEIGCGMHEGKFQEIICKFLEFKDKSCYYINLMKSAQTISEIYKQSLFVEKNTARLQWWNKQDPKKMVFLLAKGVSTEDIAKDDFFDESNLISSKQHVGFFNNKKELQTVFSLEWEDFLILMDVDKNRFNTAYRFYIKSCDKKEDTYKNKGITIQNSKKRWDLAVSWLCHTKHLKKLNSNGWYYLHSGLKDFGEMFHREEYRDNVNFLLDLFYKAFSGYERGSGRHPSRVYVQLGKIIKLAKKKTISTDKLFITEINRKTTGTDLMDEMAEQIAFDELELKLQKAYIEIRDKILKSGVDKRISAFYQNKVMYILDKRKLKSLLAAKNPELPEIVKDDIEKNRRKVSYGEVNRFQMKQEYYEVLLDFLRPEYDEFIQRIDDLLNTPIEHAAPMDTRVKADFIIFKHLRMVVGKGQLAPAIYVRKNPKETGFTDLEKDWLLCDYRILQDFLVVQNFDNIDAHKGKSMMGMLIMTAVREQFEFYNFNCISQHKKQANMNYAIAKIQGYRLEYNKTAAISFKDMGFIEREEEIIDKVASVLGLLYLENRNNSNYCIEKLAEGFKEIKEAVTKCLYHEEHYKYTDLKEVVIAKDFRQSRLLADLYFNQFLDNEIERIDFWWKDSPNKLLYLTHLELKNCYKSDIPKYKNIRDDYFRYDQMIINSGQPSKGYMFESKAAMRRAFTLDKELFKIMIGEKRDSRDLTELGAGYGVEHKHSFWNMFMLWLQHTRYYPNLNADILKILRGNIYKLTQNLKAVNDQKFREKFPIAFELLYQYVDEGFAIDKSTKAPSGARGAKFNEILDYLSSCSYQMNKRGGYKLSSNSNVLTLSKNTTIKSLIGKSDEWHRVQLIVALQGRDNQIKKKRVYKHLKEVDVVVGNHQFISINNLYDLSSEGLEMRHCVEMYDQHITKKEYAVFKVLNIQQDKDIKERATLGVTVKAGKISYHQCYGKRNSVVSNELREDVLTFIAQINKKKNMILNDEQVNKRLSQC